MNFWCVSVSFGKFILIGLLVRVVIEFYSGFSFVNLGFQEERVYFDFYQFDFYVLFFLIVLDLVGKDKDMKIIIKFLIGCYIFQIVF